MTNELMEGFKKVATSVGNAANNFSKDNIITALQIFLDNPFSSLSSILTVGQLVISIKNILKEKYPFLYHEWKFWDNVDKFLNSGILTEDDKNKLIDKLSNEGDKAEIGRNIVVLIGKANTDKKMACILNATKALADSRIELNVYFRICNIVLNTLEEDLQFLKNHINEKTIDYSISVGGLMTVGLVCHRGIIQDNDKSYAFTELAEIVNEYALKGDGQKGMEAFNLNKPPQTYFGQFANSEEVEEYLDKIINGEGK